jgi:hypothetical protein
MKKNIAFIGIFVLVLFLLSGCTQSNSSTEQNGIIETLSTVQLPQRVAQCENAGGVITTGCYLQMAKDKKEPLYCELVSLPSQRGLCYNRYAQEMNDPNSCDKIKGNESRQCNTFMGEESCTEISPANCLETLGKKG